MKKNIILGFLLIFIGCGQPSNERPGFNVRSGNSLNLNADLYTSCTITTFDKVNSFTININEGETRKIKPIRSIFSDTKDLVEEYTFSPSGFSAKLYLVMKADSETIKSNVSEISFSRNDKKNLVFYYDDEKALEILINCATNKVITENHILTVND